MKRESLLRLHTIVSMHFICSSNDNGQLTLAELDLDMFGELRT